MSKKKIVTSVVILLLLIAAGCLVWRCRYYFLGTSSDPVRAKENEDFGIEDFHSSVDKDGDGIDDQTDILQGARDYISTNPVYKSKYYSTGYSMQIFWRIRRITILKSLISILISGE